MSSCTYSKMEYKIQKHGRCITCHFPEQSGYCLPCMTAHLTKFPDHIVEWKTDNFFCDCGIHVLPDSVSGIDYLDSPNEKLITSIIDKALKTNPIIRNVERTVNIFRENLRHNAIIEGATKTCPQCDSNGYNIYNTPKSDLFCSKCNIRWHDCHSMRYRFYENFSYDQTFNQGCPVHTCY